MNPVYKYRWYSNINWGAHYDPKTGAHHASSTSIKRLLDDYGAINLQNLQVFIDGKGFEWVSNVPISMGGLKP